MKILLTAVGWAIALGISTFFFIISSMAYQIDPQGRMSQLTAYGLMAGIIGGASIALIMLWSQPAIKWNIALLFVLIWSLSLLVGLRMGWHIIQPNFTSDAMSRGVVFGMTIGGIIGGFFTAIVLQKTRLLVSWQDVFFVTFGWALATFSGVAVIFLPPDLNYIPMGFITVPIIGGLLTGGIGSGMMFWKIN